MDKSHVLSLSMMTDAIESDPNKDSNAFYNEGGLVVVFGMSGIMGRFLRPQSPYLIEDYRCGLVLEGELHGRINLVDHHMSEGSLVYVSPGSFVEPLEVSGNFHISGIGMSQDMFHVISRYSVPSIFKGRIRDGCISLDAEQSAFVRQLLGALKGMLMCRQSGSEARYSMVSAVIHHFSDLFTSHEDRQVVLHDSASALFDKFIYSVNVDAGQHRWLGYYADKMCITGRYLGMVVKRVSGVAAKEWIDRAAVTSAKVKLRHSGMQISDIAYEMNFPSTSFFCRYFKRLTGYTPQEFRRA